MNKEFIISKEKQSTRSKTLECPICGKSFYVRNKEYVYKRYNKNGYMRFACSYSCYNKLCDVITHSVKTD